MRLSVLFASSAALLLVGSPAAAVTIGFECLTNNLAGDCAIGEAQLSVGQFGVAGYRKCEPLQFLAQVGGEGGEQLTDDVSVDGSEALQAGGIQWLTIDFVEQSFGHGREPRDLVFGHSGSDQVGVVLRR